MVVNEKRLPKSQQLKITLKFLIPSLMGVFLFLIPVFYDGNTTIPIAVLAKWLQAVIAPIADKLLFGIVLFSGIATLIASLVKPAFIKNSEYLSSLFTPNPIWVVIRLVGALFAGMVLFQFGAESIVHKNTGMLVYNDLMPVLLSVFIFAGVFLPLLLNFGLLELIGSILTLVMRPLFNLPGRSAIDCLASWLGDGSVGIMLTIQQYEEKQYTAREAAVISTSFSAVSITFGLVVLAQVKLEHMFLPFYGTVCLAGVVAAIVMPRIPPLSRKKDTLIDGKICGKREVIPDGYTPFSWGWHLALNKAASIEDVKKPIKDGAKNALEMVIGLLPVVMAIGTLALIVAEFTPFFEYLGKPFAPFLELLGLPEAVQASKTIVVGFADMFVPSIMAADISSPMTRFVIAALSITQLIYMSEVGALILGSAIPLNLFEIFIIFILRTLITLPVIVGMAHLFF